MPEPTPIPPRRQVLVTGAALAALPLASGAASEPVAETTHGRLRGSAGQGVLAFKGVPYAASPTGAARFEPPGPLAPWAGERRADMPGATAPQLRSAGLPVFAYTNPAPEQSEDCLTLSIHTPGLRDGRRRPVLVWLHGGAWSSGAGTAPVLDGSALAREQDVVVVAVNHRLNLFGFLQAEGLSPGAGNNGVLDMVAALRWVRDNAEAFGGDPGCVTIFGQSGGAAKVAALMAAPAARGLFHRAIMQSGSGALRLATAEDAARAAHGLLAEFELRPADAARLRGIPADRLLAAMAKVVAANGGANNFRPVLDGVVFHQHPFDTAAPAAAQEVPLLIGSAETEVTFYLAPDRANFSLSAEQLRARVRRFLRLDAEATEQVLAGYRAALPAASPSDLLVAICSDQNYRMGMIQAAGLQAAAGGGAGLALPVHLAQPGHGRGAADAAYRGAAVRVRQPGQRGGVHRRRPGVAGGAQPDDGALGQFRPHRPPAGAGRAGLACLRDRAPPDYAARQGRPPGRGPGRRGARGAERGAALRVRPPGDLHPRLNGRVCRTRRRGRARAGGPIS